MTVHPFRPLSNVAAVYKRAPVPREVRLPFFRGAPAQAGFPSPAGDYTEDELDLAAYLVRNPVATFFVRVRGDSLTDIGILDGDVVAVDRSITPREGCIVVASLDGEIVCKVYESVAGRLALASRNARVAYPTLFLDKYQEHTLWGVVTSIGRRL